MVEQPSLAEHHTRTCLSALCSLSQATWPLTSSGTKLAEAVQSACMYRYTVFCGYVQSYHMCRMRCGLPSSVRILAVSFLWEVDQTRKFVTPRSRSITDMILTKSKKCQKQAANNDAYRAPKWEWVGEGPLSEGKMTRTAQIKVVVSTWATWDENLPMTTVRKKRGKEEVGGGISSITPAPLKSS